MMVQTFTANNMKTIQILLVAFFATTQVQAQGIMLAGGAVEEEPPSFLPSDVPNLKAWYDANDMDGDGTNPSVPPNTWVDKSASGFDLIRSGGPIFSSLNGNDVVYFDGVDDFYESSVAASNWSFLHDDTDNTIFIVMDSDVNNAISGIISTRSTGADVGIFIGTDDRASASRNEQMFWVINNGTSGVNVALLSLSNGTMPYDNYYLFRFEKDLDNPVLSDKLIGYRNNIEVADNTVYNSPSGLSPSVNLLVANNNNSAIAKFTGYIAEIIIYDRLLTTQEITNVENYLSTKYGL